MVLGYLLWPGARRPRLAVHLDAALDSARAYLALALRAPRERPQWPETRGDAYRLAHRARSVAEAALLEPPPVSSLAAPATVAAVQLEDTVDLITAVASAVDVGRPVGGLVDDVEHRLDTLVRVPDSHQG